MQIPAPAELQKPAQRTGTNSTRCENRRFQGASACPRTTSGWLRPVQTTSKKQPRIQTGFRSPRLEGFLRDRVLLQCRGCNLKTETWHTETNHPRNPRRPRYSRQWTQGPRQLRIEPMSEHRNLVLSLLFLHRELWQCRSEAFWINVFQRRRVVFRRRHTGSNRATWKNQRR